MKENPYDEKDFFEKYSQFPRSLQGLEGAGEWHTLKPLLPDFKGKRVLDIGCGFGWHCVYGAENGAKSILGIDLSENMIAVAKERNPYPDLITYRQMAMEDMNFPENSFDIVMSSLAFHYTDNIKKLYKTINRLLTKGGQFVFSVEHPIFTAQGSQQWIDDEKGQPAYWPVDRYFDQGRREAIFLGEKVVKFHHTLTAYVQGLLETGFTIKALAEPMPPKEWVDTSTEMADELRRPMMLILSAEKNEKTR